MHARRHGSDYGAVIFGAILLFVGGYYLLRNTFGFDLGELDGEKIWPIVLIAIGVGVVIRAVSRGRDAEGTDRPG